MAVVRLLLDTFSSEIQSGSDSASLPYEPLPGTHELKARVSETIFVYTMHIITSQNI